MREYERTLTTVANSYVQPQVARYVAQPGEQLRDAAACSGELSILRSDGGLAAAEVAAPSRRSRCCCPARPAGSPARSGSAGQSGYRDLLTFDMGGTSTDVALVQDLTPRIGRETKVGDLTVRASSRGRPHGRRRRRLDRARARADQGAAGRPAVGRAPSPGPAAYGMGGTEPTVTDANVVLGYLPTVAGRRRDHPGRRRRPGGRADDRRRDGPAERRGRGGRASSTSSTRTCSAACGWSRCSRGSTRATSRWSRSAAPARCTPTRSAG